MLSLSKLLPQFSEASWLVFVFNFLNFVCTVQRVPGRGDALRYSVVFETIRNVFLRLGGGTKCRMRRW